MTPKYAKNTEHTPAMVKELRAEVLRLERENKWLRKEDDRRTTLLDRHTEQLQELARENARLREQQRELEQAHDEEMDEWKVAAGLNIGGDPGDVTPAHVTKLIRQYDAVAKAAGKVLLDGCVIDTSGLRHELQQALAALPREE